MKIDRSTRSFAILSALIICISTVLLAIWSIRDTIALRNVLLVLGALVALFLIKQYLKQPQKIASNSIWHYAPIILSACTLVWVGIHYLVFSQDSALQLKDLTSTWVRVLMASMIGAATGLVIRTMPNAVNIYGLVFFAALRIYWSII